MIAQKRLFTDLADFRLVERGNRILGDLFSKSVHSIRQLSGDESAAKGCYRFLQNARVSEDDIISNMVTNCRAAAGKGRHVICIQDTTDINLSSQRNRIKKDSYIGTTNAKGVQGLGFLLHPSLVIDAETRVPYGYGAVKVWNRPLAFRSKKERQYNKLPITEKESYRWIEVSEATKAALGDTVATILIVQDREGDIYEQFATVPDSKTDLLIRARTNRTLKDKTKLFSCLSVQPAQGSYKLTIAGNGKQKQARTATIELRYREVTLNKTDTTSKGVVPTVTLCLIEAREVGYEGPDKIGWHLLTTLNIDSIELAKACIEWYSWRWTIEELFKILKKEGYDIEESELGYASSVRKLSLMIMEVVIKLFLMRLSYAEPEIELSAESCFSKEEQEFLEHQILRLEGKTEKQKNPYKTKDLKRYVWALARLGGWKGYESRRHPGITTLWIGLKQFKTAQEGWELHKYVSAR